jgi:hypothetical protein
MVVARESDAATTNKPASAGRVRILFNIHWSFNWAAHERGGVAVGDQRGGDFVLVRLLVLVLGLDDPIWFAQIENENENEDDAENKKTFTLRQIRE